MKESKLLLYMLGGASIFMSLFGIFQGVSPTFTIGLPFMYYIGVITGYTIHKFDKRKKESRGEKIS